MNRFYYGWLMLTATAAAQVVSWGILYYGFSVFVAPLQAEFGWSTPAITGAFSLALLCSGLAAWPVGRWIDRHGPRALMTTGSVLGSLMLLAWAGITQLWQLYLVLAGIGLAMAAVLYEPAFAMVATWFRQKRGQALTLLTFFGAWASFVFIPFSAWLVQQASWRQALVVLAATLAVLTIPPHALLLRRRPADLGLLPDGAAHATLAEAALPPETSISTAAALREPGFWWLSLAFALSLFATVALTVHLIPYLLAHGHSPAFAAFVAGLFGLMSLAGRLLIGPLGDRWPRQFVTGGLLLMQAIALLVLALAPTAIGALVFIVLFGAGSGTMTIMRAALLAERYGPAHFASISGAQGTLLMVARTLAPLGAGLLALGLGGYVLLFYLLAALLLVGVAVLLAAGTLYAVQ